jgi:hypothetical protein
MCVLRKVVGELVHEGEVQELHPRVVRVGVLIEQIRHRELPHGHDQTPRRDVLLDEVPRPSQPHVRLTLRPERRPPRFSSRSLCLSGYPCSSPGPPRAFAGGPEAPRRHRVRCSSRRHRKGVRQTSRGGDHDWISWPEDDLRSASQGGGLSAASVMFVSGVGVARMRARRTRPARNDGSSERRACAG